MKEELQGKGYLIDDGKSKVIIVEHETGLEILYIAGSIASLISLIPRILHSWCAIRNHFSNRQRRDIDIRGVEIRRIGAKGQLIEDHVHDTFEFSSAPMEGLYPVLTTVADAIENEIKELKENVQSLTVRMKALEKQYEAFVGNKKKSAKQKNLTNNG